MGAAGLERLRRLLELSSEWFWEQDAESRFTRIEAGGAAERGGPDWSAAYIGKRSWELAWLEPLEGSWDEHRVVVQAHRPFRNLILKRSGDGGRTQYVSVSGQPRFDAEGGCLGYEGITRDVTERITAERALRESESRYRAMFEAMHEAVLVRDRDMRIVVCNASAERLFGVPREQFLGRTDTAAAQVWNEDGSPLRTEDRPVWKTWTTGKPQIDQVIGHARKDGVRMWMLVNAQPVYAEGDPEPVMVVASFADITARKEAERALKESEALNRAVVDSLHEGVFVRGPDETFIACNASAERILGLRADEILGRKTLEDSLRFLNDDGTPADASRRRVGIRSLGHGTSESGFVFGVIRRDGRRVWISANAEPVVFPGEDQVRGAVISFSDITEQREAEKRLRASQAANRMLAKSLQQSTDVIYSKDTNGVVTSWNAGCERLYGYSPEEALGRTLHELQMRNMSDEQWAAQLEKFRSGTSRQVESTRIAKDGREIAVSAVLSPLFDEDGKLVGEICNARDVTELRRAQHEIEQLNRELERRVIERTAELEAVNRELEAFAYSVSHDLRAPLRSISGFSDLLSERVESQLDPEAKDHLKRVRASAGRMSALIDDLLKLSRVARGEFRRQPVDLSELAEAILAAAAREAPERRFEARIAPDLKAHADLGLMRIMLENLLGNAWKFTGKRDRAQIEFGATRDESDTVFHVRDNGAGFDMAYVERLFKPFQRLHVETEFEGTGIGLATVRRIVNRHGGRIWVESQPGAGTTFYFTV